jgi:hypothetical protein
MKGAAFKKACLATSLVTAWGASTQTVSGQTGSNFTHHTYYLTHYHVEQRLFPVWLEQPLRHQRR